MGKIVLFLALITQTTFVLASDPQKLSCRDAVVLIYDVLGTSIDRDSFSNSKFIDLGISIEEFNLMEPAEQEEIYRQIKPLEIMVKEALNLVTQEIGDLSGTYYEFFMADKLELMREARKELKTCEYDKTTTLN